MNLLTAFNRPYFNLILVGTTGGRLIQTGQLVAERQNARFIALETEIRTREGYSADDIRGLFGIARLRRVENELCHELALQRGAVLGVNCGTLLDEDNRTRLAESGAILALTCSLNETLRRLYIAQGAHFHDPAVRALALDTIRRDGQALRLTDSPQLETTRLTVEQAADYAASYWYEHGMENSPGRMARAKAIIVPRI